MRFYWKITSVSTNVLFLFQDPNLHLIVLLSYSLPTCGTPVVFSYPYNPDTFEGHLFFGNFISLGCLIDSVHFWQELLKSDMALLRALCREIHGVYMFYYRWCYPWLLGLRWYLMDFSFLLFFFFSYNLINIFAEMLWNYKYPDRGNLTRGVDYPDDKRAEKLNNHRKPLPPLGLRHEAQRVEMVLPEPRVRGLAQKACLVRLEPCRRPSHCW